MKRILILGGITITIAAAVYAGPGILASYLANNTDQSYQRATSTPERLPDKEVWKQERLEQADFQDKIDAELEKEYYKKTIKDATDALKELENQGFTGEQVSQLKSYLQKYNPVLVAYAAEIVELPRYSDIVAIATAETHLCTRGVGESRNNCGAIKGGRDGFKVYSTPMDALEDMAILLEKPHFKGKTIEEMNGVYCVDEVAGSGPCPEWGVNVERHLTELLTS